MRIAFFSDNFFPELSGISDSILLLGKSLAARGHSVHYYVPGYSTRNYEKAGLLKTEITLGERMGITRLLSVPYPTGTGQGRAVIPTGFRALSIREFQPDILHSQLFFTVGLEALFASRILNKPIIGTNHTAVKEFARYSPVKSGIVENFLIKYVNWYYAACDLVTAPSASVGEEMRQFGFTKDVRVISNPIDTETFAPAVRAKATLKKKLRFSAFTVMHAGRLAAERKIDVIIKAVAAAKARIPELELALAGGGADEGRLRSLAQTLGISDSVKFLGVLSKPALAEAYNASDLFLITSTADTQSLVMLQAMACGLPVIGVRARALPEYIRPENGVLIEPDNDGALAEKIVAQFNHPTTRKKLGGGARKYVMQFSASAIAGQWEQIYADTIRKYNFST